MSDNRKIKLVANIANVQGKVDIKVNGGSSKTSFSHEPLSRQLQTEETMRCPHSPIIQEKQLSETLL